MNPPRTYVFALLRILLMWGTINALIRATEIFAPRIFAAAHPAIPTPPTSPFAAIAIADLLAGFATPKRYVSHTNPKDWGHPAYLIDQTFMTSAAWEPFMRNNRAGVNAVNSVFWEQWHHNEFFALWKKNITEGQVRTAYISLCRWARAATEASTNPCFTPQRHSLGACATNATTPLPRLRHTESGCMHMHANACTERACMTHTNARRQVHAGCIAVAPNTSCMLTACSSVGG